MALLLTTSETTEEPADLVRRAGAVVAEFGPLTQDSGNVSWLVDTVDGRLFVKTAGRTGPPEPGDPVPWLDHAGRVGLLRNAVALFESCEHPALARLLNVVESPVGPALVYEAAPGELVHVPAERRADPASAYQRFAHLPADDLLAAFDTLLDAHRALDRAGWQACDLYDGCLIHDEATGRLTLIDLDTYRRGDGTNTMGRMFGSSRYMAPEESELGAVLDARTTVFTLGRLLWHFGTRLTEDPAAFCGSPALTAVAQRACALVPSDRYPDARTLADEWDRARTGPP